MGPRIHYLINHMTLEEKIDLVIEGMERQFQWNEKHSSRLEKLYQWIEKLSQEIGIIRKDLQDFKLYQFQKNDELFEIIHEMKDDLRVIKALASRHEEDLKEFQKHTKDDTRHIHHP